MGNFRGNLEQHMILDVAIAALSVFARHFGERLGQASEVGRSNAGPDAESVSGVSSEEDSLRPMWSDVRCEGTLRMKRRLVGNGPYLQE